MDVVTRIYLVTSKKILRVTSPYENEPRSMLHWNLSSIGIDDPDADPSEMVVTKNGVLWRGDLGFKIFEHIVAGDNYPAYVKTELQPTQLMRPFPQ